MATQRSNFIHRSLLAAALLFVLGGANAAPIGQIIDNPRAYVDKTVTIEGNVTGMFSLVVFKYFTVNDGTASINVVTDRPLPRKGQRIRVRGKVSELFSLGSQSLLVLLEDDKEEGVPGIETTGVPQARGRNFPGAL